MTSLNCHSDTTLQILIEYRRHNCQLSHMHKRQLWEMRS